MGTRQATEYYSLVKRNAVLMHAIEWINLKNIIPSEMPLVRDTED